MNMYKFNVIELFGIGGLLLMAAVFYNTGLAVVNAHVMAIGTIEVALVETFLVLCGIGYAGLKIRYYENIYTPLIFLLFMLLMFVYVSFVNEHFFPKSFRDMLLIGVFFMLGGLASEQNIINSFRFITVSILIFMIIENFKTSLYVDFFEPAKYYANTRGVRELEVDDTGLFRNSLGYADRFTFNISSHRLSSIFLEQVSFANFAMVLAIFTCTFWQSLKKIDRVFFLGMVPLMVMTNSSRTASLVCCLILFGFFVFPMLPRYSNVLYMPLILIMSVLVFYDPHFMPFRMEDSLPGRINHSLYFLKNMGIGLFMGGPIDMIYRTMDSGYAYILFTQTIFGLIAFWLFTSLIVPPYNAANKRFAHSTALYIFLNLLIGAAIFSIKVSAPLWFIAGYLYYQRYKPEPPEMMYEQSERD